MTADTFIYLTTINLTRDRRNETLDVLISYAPIIKSVT